MPQAVWILVVTALAIALLVLFFRKTTAGLAMRAVASNPTAAAVVGLKVRRVRTASFALAGALGGLAGILVTPITTLRYDVGVLLGLKGFSAAILGGFGSFPGAIVGGISLGLLESLGRGVCEQRLEGHHRLPRAPSGALCQAAGPDGKGGRVVTHRVLMGNEAIGRGIVECGCSVAASYPGTPASEILESVVAFCKETGSRMHIEWSVNEKVAYEVALAASYTGKRAAVAMKQVGLNVASDPFMRSAYLGVKGGFLLVSADDPGPHSSQTEQDSRFFAMFAKIPVLDPSSPREAKEMVRLAFELSEEYEIPVMLRPTTRVCHARQAVPLLDPERVARTARFEKDPKRWCATPRFVTDLHRELTEKLVRISADPRLVPAFFPGDDTVPRTCDHRLGGGLCPHPGRSG